MKLLIIVPKQPLSTGNHVTAKRFVDKLHPHGWDAVVIEAGFGSAKKISAAARKSFPDALLLVHAYRSGRPFLQAGLPSELPVLVLMTGTDYNHDRKIPERAAIIEDVFERAGTILLQNHLLFQRLGRELGRAGNKLRLLPPGIRVGDEHYPLREKLKLLDSTPLFLFPAGIRPVKGNLDLLLMCDRLAEMQPNFHLAFCGPPLDEEYTACFFDTLDARPWAHYLGEIPKMAMADVMRQSDVILNNSRSEGVSNALVEAVALGRPILASDIAGNRAVVQHGKNGLLYFGQEQFVEQALQLCRDLKLRARLSRPNPSAYSAEREGALLANILNEVTASALGDLA